jgi:biotin-(acetyl-CoA carboxylase) ligase
MSDASFMDDYRRRSILDGRDILLEKDDGIYSVHCIGIDPEGRLLVRYENGKEEAVLNGSVTLIQ